MTASSTIGNLRPYNVDMLSVLSEFKIPVEYVDQNYCIRVVDILSLITKNTVGLGSVDNTPDAEKPVSTKMLVALSEKAGLEHDHSVSDVIGLSDILSSLRSLEVKIPLTEVEGLVEELSGLMASTWRPSVEDVQGLVQALEGKAEADHSHDFSSLTGFDDFITAIDARFANYATKAFVTEAVQAQAEIDEGRFVQDRPELSSW